MIFYYSSILNFKWPCGVTVHFIIIIIKNVLLKCIQIIDLITFVILIILFLY